jgi:hypothetical protein
MKITRKQFTIYKNANIGMLFNDKNDMICDWFIPHAKPCEGGVVKEIPSLEMYDPPLTGHTIEKQFKIYKTFDTMEEFNKWFSEHYFVDLI